MMIFYESMKPLLNLFKDKEVLHTREIQKLINGHFSITDENIEWALLYLSIAGLIDHVYGGAYRITDEGLSVLSEDPEIIDMEYLSKYDSFRSFRHSRDLASNHNEDTVNTVAYNKQPTLLIGLGGLGSQIMDNVYGRVQSTNNVSVFVIDTNVHNYSSLNNIPKGHFIAISTQHSIIDCLHYLPDANEWFPLHHLLLSKTISEGSGQIRSISRLAYEIALKERRFDKLLDEAEKIAKKCIDNNCHMRVSIATSLLGGTGSGIFIQIALLIREHIKNRFPYLNVKIHGEFVLPSSFAFRFNFPLVERRNMESNTYAALKELNVINEHFFGNAPPLSLRYGYKENTDKTYIENLPYDYCFLYDRVDYSNRVDQDYIENAITERLFGFSANAVNDEFVNGLRSDVRKHSNNLYGMISTERISCNDTVFESDIFRYIINRIAPNNGKRILSITSPQHLHIDLTQLPQETVFVEQIDPDATDITVTELVYGIEIDNIEKLRYRYGQYYLSYKSLTDSLPRIISPHLDKRWHEELHNIGEDPEIADSFSATTYSSVSTDKVNDKQNNLYFISYSSKDKSIADFLCSKLEKNGIKVWYAPRDVKDAYASAITDAIDNAHCFIVVLSENSIQSPHVLNEIELAFQNLSNGIKIKPIRIDNTPYTKDIKYYLSRQHWFDATCSPLEEKLNEFVSVLLNKN